MMNYLVHPAEARRRFSEFAEGDITYANLAYGALLIALEDNPGVDIERYVRELDELTARVKRRSRTGEPPIFTLGHIHAEMFDVDHYTGDAVNYYDVRNAYLSDVIDRKMGLPISLSIIFLHVASWVGLNAAGVGLPGHYITKVQFELNEIYVDPFHGGATLTAAEVLTEFKTTREHLKAWDARQTLVRVLTNLQNMWTQAGDPRKAANARERIAIAGVA